MVSEALSAAGRANIEAYERMCRADPVLVDVAAALDVVPGMTPETILASGPRLAWDEYAGGAGRLLPTAPCSRASRPTSKMPSGSLQPARSVSRPARTTAASDRWPGSTPLQCRFSWSRTARSGISPFATSTKASPVGGSTTAPMTTGCATSFTSSPTSWPPPSARPSGGREASR